MDVRSLIITYLYRFYCWYNYWCE